MEKARILIVEDEELTARDIKNALEGMGYAVPAIVGSGIEAIKKAEEIHPDLVLMDIVLKGDLDGIRTAELIRTRFDIPVVYLTSYADKRTLQKAGITHSYGYILKPLEEKDLQTTLTMAFDRYAMERKLKESEKIYRKLSQEFNALLDAIPDNLTLHSPDLSIIWANKGVAEGLGKEISELIGKNCYRLWHKRSTPCEVCPVQRSFLSGNMENDISISFDGRMWDIRAVPIKDEKGAVINVIELSRDITEHRRLEEQLRQAQKMEVVGQLAGGIAHDFNNILTAIIGYGNLIQMKTEKGGPLYSYTEQILTSAERAANLTHSLLAFSRKQVIALRPVDLNDIVRRVEKLLARLISEDIELRTVFEERVLNVMADSVQIEHALINLVTNSRDAMPEGGLLTIETSVIEIDEEFLGTHDYGRPGTYAVVSVIDTGTGIDENVKEKIFEPFFTTKEVGKGTGLGLSMVYGIVKQHEGYIDVESKPGRGSTFRILLPLTDIKVEKAEETGFVNIRGGTETILVAEDDAAVRKLTGDMLRNSGYEVITAGDGEDALMRFLENKDRVRLLLLDVIMPRMNGKEAHDKIHKINPGIKVIFLSGYTDEIIKEKEAGDENLIFLSKPVPTDILLKKVREVLDGK
jgi:two-component system, cell cycle sensor histidine kinase and response regulator CckA